jgi:membrane protein implicated in regulation of membrane protease activity
VVWHHRRNSVRGYWRQQLGYGKAEALLERKWPQRYNEFGHAAWAGRVYGRGRAQGRGRIYHGTWGAAPFQSLYEPTPRSLSVLPRMPEWYLVLLCLAALSALGALWAPLRWASLLLALGAGASLVQAFAGARRASFTSAPRSRAERLTLRLLAACLHLMQPAARLRGRLKHGLSPWRLRTGAKIELPRPRTRSIWTDQHQSPESRLAALEQVLRAAGAYVRRGGDFDRWDLEIRGGALSGARLLMAVEEHRGGRQYVRLRCWPRITSGAVMTLVLVAGLAVSAALDAAHAASAILGATGVLIGVRMLLEYSGAMAAIRRAVPPEERARSA